jgi:hypothetical protein
MISKTSKRYLIDLRIDDVLPPLENSANCRYCQKQLSGRQTKWCSKECNYKGFDDLMFAKGSSKHLREKVFARDKGICAKR